MNMEELSVLKSLLNITDNSQDEILKFYLESAKNVICEIRNSDYVEDAYVTTKIKIAVELYNKRGIEGQLSSNELGIDRGYENSGISKSLLSEITPFIKTPFSVRRTQS